MKIRIRSAGDVELNKVCDVLTSEFFNDPVLKFAFIDRDPDRRSEVMRRFFRFMLTLPEIMVEFFRPKTMQVY